MYPYDSPVDEIGKSYIDEFHGFIYTPEL